MLILFFGVFNPAVSLVYIAATPMALDWGRLLFGGVGVGSLIGGVQLWRRRAVEYEFTGEEIIERRRGEVHGRVPIADILEIRVLMNPHRMILRMNNAKMDVRIFPSLNEVIQREVARVVTDEARQRMEEVKQELVARQKKAALWIAGIALIILVAGILLIIGNSGVGIKK